MEGEVEVLKTKYQITKVNAKRIVAKAKDAERERIHKQLDEEYKKGTLFRVAKQMKKKNRDIVGGACVKNEGERMEAWRRHSERISNEEFGWNRNLPEIDSQRDSNGVEDITLEDITFSGGRLCKG